MAVEPTPDLARVIEARNFVSLQEMLKHWTPSTAAGLIEGLPVEQQVLAFRVLPRDLAADVFEYLPLEAQERLLKAMAKEEVAKILNEMAPDDRTALLDELPATVTQQLLQLLTPEERSVAVKLLGYPEGCIGRLLTPDYVRVRPDWTIGLRAGPHPAHGHDSETLSIVYVIDERGRLIDDIRIRKILLLPPDTRVAELMDERVVALKATDDAGVGRPCVPAGGPHRAARHRFPRHAHRDRHRRRRAGRRRDRPPPGHSSGSAAWRRSTSRTSRCRSSRWCGGGRAGSSCSSSARC